MPSYDRLDSADQADERARSAAEIDQHIEVLDLAAEFEAAGVRYSELDARGVAVVRRQAPDQ